MKTEELAWKRLHEHAAAQLSPGFADRVLRKARAATAALCLVAVALYNAGSSSDEAAQSLAGWSEIAAQAGDLESGQ